MIARISTSTVLSSLETNTAAASTCDSSADTHHATAAMSDAHVQDELVDQAHGDGTFDIEMDLDI
jgi:hypothetical protein